METPVSPIGSVFPAQPSWEVDKEDPYTNVQRRTGGGETVAPGPEFKQALGNIDATTQQRVAAESNLTNVKKDIAGVEAQGATANVGVYNASEAEGAAVHAQLAPEIARRMAQSKADIEEFRARPAPELFADRSTAANLALAIGLAGAAFGDAMAAKAAALLGQSKGPSTVTAIINMDLDRQREKLKRAADKMAQSGKNVEEIRAYEDRLDKRIEAKRLIALEKAHATLLMGLKGKGMDLAAAQGTKDALDLQAAIDQQKASLVQSLTDKTVKAETTTTDMGGQTKTTNREPTEKHATEKLPSVQQSVQLARIQKAAPAVTQLLDQLTPEERGSIHNMIKQDTLFERNPTGALVWETMTGDQLAGMTPNARRALQAVSEAADAEAGITTGAVASRDQILNKVRRWMPGAKAQKADLDHAKQNIHDDVNDVYGLAGGPGQRPAAAAGTSPAGSPTSGKMTAAQVLQRARSAGILAEDDANGPGADAPLGEDPEADEAGPITKRGKPVKEARPAAVAQLTEAEVIARATRAGQIHSKEDAARAVAQARRLGYLK